MTGPSLSRYNGCMPQPSGEIPAAPVPEWRYQPDPVAGGWVADCAALGLTVEADTLDGLVGQIAAVQREALGGRNELWRLVRETDE